jgi:hypothetical protein
MKNKISLSEKQEQENRETKLVISFFFFFLSSSHECDLKNEKKRRQKLYCINYYTN